MGDTSGLGRNQVDPDASGLRKLSLDMQRQPNDQTCGPTCLHAVYRYWGVEVSLNEVVASVLALNDEAIGRGTLAVNLGIDAMQRGFAATLYTFNLNVFDPTWFDRTGVATPAVLHAKLPAQAEAKSEEREKFRAACRAYLRFAALGGQIRMEDLTSELISGHIRAGRPVLTGLSATWLYRASREFGPNDDEDDILGMPQGHFVVLHGYEPEQRLLHVADPLEDNYNFGGRNYTVAMSRIVPAILLGVLTYDANLLVLEPKAVPEVAGPIQES
jgi:hypothetical protein